ncbi:hypothetical protein L1285_12070 [Pseudoalteromonas sp. DL2-H2.2]|uniref:hypothetical protein n=1 Tax=Pseudoalteromonas sp. DL2-H2.2 TaxID=2908889 RepID=UPI001F2A0D2D|nr:hypothetical protein [Pseudoalteromonas sp. DL2-H2.2]MCF2909055.1 hypothetical protein [Pseudoalteromonas sp. DL2-H2.2]
MAKRINKFTPVASTIALSLGLSGCSLFEDDDKNVPVTTPQEVESTVTANFSVSVSGKAVKGTLSGAQVSVKTLDAQGNIVDLAYRTQAGEESATEKSLNTEDAKKKAEEKLVASNPADFKTDPRGFFQLFVDENFSGPLYITVKTTKDGDALVKCDAFVGCGEGVAIDNGDGIVKDNGKIDFGEWYKDDIELSVVKVISPNTAARPASARNQPSFADGDNNQYTANATIFTSTAVKMLLDAAAEQGIDSAKVGEASTKVLKALIGNTKLVASLTGDLSLGGAVDFTDVGQGESIDEGVLALIQVAASLQTIAGKEGKSTNDVLTDLANDVGGGDLTQSDTFKKVRDETSKAAKILVAMVSNDAAALEQALVDAGVSAEDAASVADKVNEAKKKAVDNGATTDEDLNKDVEQVKEQLEDLGNEDVVVPDENDENDVANAALLIEINASSSQLDTTDTDLSQLNATLTDVKALAETLDTKAQAIAYFAAASELNASFEAQKDAIATILSTETTNIDAHIAAAQALVEIDAKYQPTLDLAVTLKEKLTSLVEFNTSLATQIAEQFSNATKVVDEFDVKLDASAQAAASALESATTAKASYTEQETPLQAQVAAVKSAVEQIVDLDTAIAALNLVTSAKTSLSGLTDLSQDFSTKATVAVSTATDYKAEADAQGEQVEQATEALQNAQQIKADADTAASSVTSYTSEINTAEETALERKRAFEQQLEDDKELNEALIGQISEQLQILSVPQGEITGYESELVQVKEKGANANTLDGATEYYTAALTLQTTVSVEKQNSWNTTLSGVSTKAQEIVSSATALANRNSDYTSTKDNADALLASTAQTQSKVSTLVSDIDAEVINAASKLTLEQQIAAALKLTQDVILETQDAAAEVTTKQAEFEAAFIAAQSAFNAIENLGTAQQALDAANAAIAAGDAYKQAVANYVALSNAAVTAAQSYKNLVDSREAGQSAIIQTNSEDPTELLALANELQVKAVAANAAFEQDARPTEAAELKTLSEEKRDDYVADNDHTELGKQGTDKLVNISFVTKEGADAVFNAGEVIYDVVRDIWDSGLDSGNHSGTAPNFPDWTYSYDTDEYKLSLTNTQGDEQIEGIGQVNSGAQSKILFTWSGLLKADSGQKIEIQSADLAECERWSIDAVVTPNASCTILYVDGSIQKVEDARDFDIPRAKTFNLVEFVDGQYGFDGTFSSEATAVDAQGNPVALFTDGAIELADVTLSGRSEDIDFTAHFDLRNESDSNDLGLANIMLDNFNGYVFKVSLIDESGPLLGDVSINNDTNQPIKVGDVEEVNNGFRIDYINGESIEYTDIDFLGQSNN